MGCESDSNAPEISGNFIALKTTCEALYFTIVTPRFEFACSWILCR
jgi:hypothetical protein